jgi:uncharacterized membrane protein
MAKMTKTEEEAFIVACVFVGIIVILALIKSIWDSVAQAFGGYIWVFWLLVIIAIIAVYFLAKYISKKYNDWYWSHHVR